MRTTTSPKCPPSDYNEQCKALSDLPSTFAKTKQGKGTTSSPSWTNKWIKYETWWPTTSLLPLRHLKGGDAQVANLRNVIELKHYNTIKMKMLAMHTPTSPKKLYIKLRPDIMSTREDHETSTTKTELRLLPPLRHLRQVFSRHPRLWMLCHLRPSSTATTTRWLSMGFSLRP